MRQNANRLRCPWATTEPAIAYHDEEWGVPVHDDRLLFEFLILEGAQAGLSWITILRKRENYRKAFDRFRAEKIARYAARDLKRLLRNEGIVRNRLKIAATIQNAKAFLAVRKEFGVETRARSPSHKNKERIRPGTSSPSRSSRADSFEARI
jgi:DNA-3-methyladenine glycosylase I